MGREHAADDRVDVRQIGFKESQTEFNVAVEVLAVSRSWLEPREFKEKELQKLEILVFAY